MLLDLELQGKAHLVLSLIFGLVKNGCDSSSHMIVRLQAWMSQAQVTDCRLVVSCKPCTGRGPVAQCQATLCGESCAVTVFHSLM